MKTTALKVRKKIRDDDEVLNYRLQYKGKTSEKLRALFDNAYQDRDWIKVKKLLDNHGKQFSFATDLNNKSKLALLLDNIPEYKAIRVGRKLTLAKSEEVSQEEEILQRQRKKSIHRTIVRDEEPAIDNSGTIVAAPVYSNKLRMNFKISDKIARIATLAQKAISNNLITKKTQLSTVNKVDESAHQDSKPLILADKSSIELLALKKDDVLLEALTPKIEHDLVVDTIKQSEVVHNHWEKAIEQIKSLPVIIESIEDAEKIFLDQESKIDVNKKIFTRKEHDHKIHASIKEIKIDQKYSYEVNGGNEDDVHIIQIPMLDKKNQQTQIYDTLFINHRSEILTHKVTGKIDENGRYKVLSKKEIIDLESQLDKTWYLEKCKKYHIKTQFHEGNSSAKPQKPSSMIHSKEISR